LIIEIKLDKEIHGEQLKKEIGCENLYVANDKVVIVGDVEEAFAKQKYDAHILVFPPQPTIEDKLASVGLSLDELRAALGGN